MKTRRPVNHMMSAQHEKVIIYDQAYVTMGSHNFTENSVRKCEEDILCTSAAQIVLMMYTHFLGVWRQGEDLTPDMVPTVDDFDAQRAQRRAEGSTSRSSARPEKDGVAPTRGRRARAPGEATATGPGAEEAPRAGTSTTHPG